MSRPSPETPPARIGAVRRRQRRARCVFRVAAGPKLGYGHLMRAQALARCLDMDVAISMRGGAAARAAADIVGPLVDDADPLRQADVLVVDDPSRAHGERWIARARRKGVQTVSVHDDEWAHEADLIVCGGLGAAKPRSEAPALRGVRFYLIDSRIAGARHLRSAHRSVANPRVLISLGGGQHVRRAAQRLVDVIINRCPTAEIAVAAGFTHGRRPALRHAAWLSSRTGLTRALLEADVAVVSGGVTLYEACAIGVPAVGLAVVPGQRRTIRAFASKGAVLDAKGGRSPALALETAAAAVARLVADAVLRQRTAARARALVDGRGAHRVARRIHALVEVRNSRRA